MAVAPMICCSGNAEMKTCINRILSAIALLSLVVLAGCVSSGGSVSSYGGPTVSSATAKHSTARKNVKSAKQELKAAAKELKAIERNISRAEKRLNNKKSSQKRRDAAKTSLKENKRKLRSAKRAVRRAERSLARAERKQKSASKAILTAKKRKADAEKRAQIAAARKQLEKNGSSDESKRGRLFGLKDPSQQFVKDYRARVDGGFALISIPIEKMDKRLYRQRVKYKTSQKVGTIVVDTANKYLYLIESGGNAMRYGIGVGKQGFAWSGKAHIGWKQEWPKWTPPEEMIARKPKLAKWGVKNGGMPGGPSNPLGARALYLMKDGKDTLYRLHGTPQWGSIGTAASSGCIRLINQDVIDLYSRVPRGTSVVVI